MNEPEFHVREERNHMATTFEFVIRCREEELTRAETLLAQAHDLVAVLELELTEFKESSPVYQLNHSAPNTPILFSKSAFELLKKSLLLSTQTASAFHPLAKSTESITQNNLIIDEFNLTVARTHAGILLSFGAIGKGYALDQVSALMDSNGFQNYVLNGGGSSIVLSGTSSEKNAWKWGWSWKKDSEGSSVGVRFDHARAHKIALGISGTHEKGQHLINIHSPGVRPNQLKSALVAHPLAADADALSTALFVCGYDSGMKILSETSAHAAAVIDGEEVPHWSKGFQYYFGQVAAKAMIVFFCLISLFETIAHAEDEAVDFSAATANSFTPYVFERDKVWLILPLFMLGFTLLHLKKDRRRSFKPNPKKEVT